MKKILVYPIGELSEKRLSRLIELELLERGAEVTWEADENVDQAIYVVGVLDDDAMETVNNTAVGAEKVVCCRYQEADSDGIIVIERPIDAAKLADGLTRSYKKEKDPRGLVIDDDNVSFRGEKVELSKKELELLKLLYSKNGEPVGRQEARDAIFPAESNSNVVDVYIRYLRKKLDLRFDTRMIVTVRNKGYMLKI
ncbi:MAG: winged helix-turn-helix transcriptional regulator [Clostridia bacterium]|nr:winged helix-turn-helix transcriptional regulator [Clostridia bacterium]